jgi:hypothetical protein
VLRATLSDSFRVTGGRGVPLDEPSQTRCERHQVPLRLWLPRTRCSGRLLIARSTVRKCLEADSGYSALGAPPGLDRPRRIRRLGSVNAVAIVFPITASIAAEFRLLVHLLAEEVTRSHGAEHYRRHQWIDLTRGSRRPHTTR